MLSFLSIFVSFANLRVPSLLNRNIGFTTASSANILIGEVWISCGQFNIEMNEKWGQSSIDLGIQQSEIYIPKVESS